MPSFYDGKRFFLTFPTIDRSPHELVAHLQACAPVKFYVVARELHVDGTPHLHACVEFVTHQRRPVDWLDSFGIHPNKQDPRKWQACIIYTKKGGDFIEGPEQVIEEDLSAIVVGMDSEELWMEYCVSKRISFNYAQWFWARLRNDDCTLLGSEFPGKMCGQLEKFQYQFGPATLVLRGDSGCGKTLWAKINAPKPCLFVRHIDTLKKFRSGYHVSIVFDDVDFRHYPRTSQIHIVDFHNPSDIHCRNTCAHIPAGIYKIFTCNEWPLVFEDPAIARRCRKYTIKDL